MTDGIHLPRKALLQYGLLALPLAFAGIPLYVHAPDYYATQFGVSLASIGVVLFILRLVDAIQDPFIGQLSRRFMRYRRHFIVNSALILTLGFALLFQPMIDNPLVWFAIFMFLATTAFSLLSINLNTLGSLWSRDSYQQTFITSIREALGILGLLLAIMLPSALSQIMPMQGAFGWVSMLLAILTAIALVAFYSWSKTYEGVNEAEEKRQTLSYRALWIKLPYGSRHFFGIYGLSMLASAMPAILVLSYIRDRLDAEALTGGFLLVYFLSGAAGMLLWQKLSHSYGKEQSWAIAMVFAVATFIWAYFLQAGDIWQYGIICMLSGVAFGADLSLPPSILAEQIHQQQKNDTAAMQFGLLAFLAKTALALGSVIVLPMLDMSGFKPGQSNHNEALHMLSLCYAVIPCAIKLLAIFWMWRAFPMLMTGDNHEKTNHHFTYRSPYDAE